MDDRSSIFTEIHLRLRRVPNIRIRPRSAWTIVTAVLVRGLALAFSPGMLIVKPSSIGIENDFVKRLGYIAMGIAALAWLGVSVWRGRRSLRGIDSAAEAPGFMDRAASGDTTTGISATPQWPLATTFAGLFGLWTLLFPDRIRAPILVKDDLEHLRVASSWPVTWDQLFEPFNGHVFSVHRLFGRTAVALLPNAPASVVLAYAGALAFLATLPLIFLVLRREWSSAPLAMLAVCLFSLTRAHQEVALWYSASQWSLALVFLLSSLLLLRTHEASGGTWRLACA